MALKDRNVAYYYDEEIGNFNYGGGNPMRPHRVRLTHSLVENYDLNKRLQVKRPTTKNTSEVTQFHADGELQLCAGKDLTSILARQEKLILVAHSGIRPLLKGGLTKTASS